MKLAIRGDLLDVVTPPAAEAGLDHPPPGVRWRPAHWLLIEDGRIAAIQTEAPDPEWTREDRSGQLILPGFIDTHVHAPQLDVIASYGTELLDWLNRYTFPAERAWAEPAVAAAGSARFLDQLLAHGSTAALVFPTVHKGSVDALFSAAEQRGMRLITGKCLMDRHAPDGLRDTAQDAERDTLDLLQRWRGRGRLAYAHTVRFAPTSSEAQLALAGELLAAHPGSYLQTHVAENRAEVQWVRELFPSDRSYLGVYERHGLLGPRSTLAHGIWLDERDRAVLRDTQAVIAHSPTSNLFLGSGLFDWRGRAADGIRLSVASDVGGGVSLSMHKTLAAAYQMAALQGQRLDAFTLLHAATAGNAASLNLGHEIGRLEPGLMADLCAWRWSEPDSVLAHRLSIASSLHEQLFAWLMLGDERLLDGVWVAGIQRR
ncbi:guanine deaminase [Inhella inkyongensis]|uniref:Guanine deaminase n=1 Tax=Inhella inkyongensis TaxID=392593 RepID=A0A840S2T4_9BURK|nr:guanine deaminase [Inhella inkyongensis]MBB5203154.1 guanine deaminase [Inhella inkyongensis]